MNAKPLEKTMRSLLWSISPQEHGLQSKHPASKKCVTRSKRYAQLRTKEFIKQNLFARSSQICYLCLGLTISNRSVWTRSFFYVWNYWTCKKQFLPIVRLPDYLIVSDSLAYTRHLIELEHEHHCLLFLIIFFITCRFFVCLMMWWVHIYLHRNSENKEAQKLFSRNPSFFTVDLLVLAHGDTVLAPRALKKSA